MNYLKYTAQNFVEDEYFQMWTVKGDPEAALFWTSWLKENPHKREEVEEAKRIIQTLNFQEDYNLNKFFVEVWRNVYRERQQGEVSRKNTSVYTLKPYYGVAASILILMTFCVFFLVKQTFNDKSISTAYNQTKQIKLPDGSVIKLNSNSSVRFSKGWGKDENREIWLQGEAFFSVVHTQTNQKFIVHVNTLDVEVLGTEFNVNNRRGKTQVVLNTGKVRLSNGVVDHGKGLIMKPGEMVIYNQTKEKYTKKDVDPKKYTSWLHKELIFENASLREIADYLEDNYGYTVKIRDRALAYREFTAKVPKENVDLLLTLISKTFKLKITKENEEIIIEKK